MHHRLSIPESRRSLAPAFLLLLLIFPGIAGAQVGPGELVVSTSASASILAVDPLTGASRPLGDGSLVSSPHRLDLLADGDVAVGSGGDLFRVDPSTGMESLVSSGLFSGGAGGIAEEAGGSILAAGTAGLLRVDPTTGVAITLVPASMSFRPSCLAVAGDGTIYASDDGIDGAGGIHRIDPVTGATSFVPAGLVDTGMCLAIDADDHLIVTLVTLNEIWRVDPSDGSRTLVPSSGTFITGPYYLAVADTGLLFVQTFLPSGNSGIVQLDPVSGEETLVYQVASPAQIRDLAVAPGTPVATVPIPTASTAALSILALLLLVVGARVLGRVD